MNKTGRFHHNFDIREYKRRIRENCKTIRKDIPAEQKSANDAKILKNITKSSHYRDCKTLLCYVSTKSEVDTHALIERALADGKRVAVPYCVENTRDMHFYLVCGLHELERRTFGVLEPVPEKATRLLDFRQSVCIVPGLSFSHTGYRLGYGGGYYDRFLNRYEGISIGVCYRQFMRRHLVTGRYDVACKYIATEINIKPVHKYNHRSSSSLSKKGEPPHQRRHP